MKVHVIEAMGCECHLISRCCESFGKFNSYGSFGNLMLSRSLREKELARLNSRFFQDNLEN